LRPTKVNPIGVTYVSPRSIDTASGSFICNANFHAHVNGIDFSVESFPFISQDTDVTVCAHAVAWMIIRYFSQKHHSYQERTPFELVKLIQDQRHGRIIPSSGLTMGQLAEIFSGAGFHPSIFVRNHYENRLEFERLLYTYVESGIPVVVAMDRPQHAVAVIGHGRLLPSTSLADSPRLIYPFELFETYIINDDNGLPYGRLIRKDVSRPHTSYQFKDISGFLVPLAEKIFLGADRIYDSLIDSLAEGLLGNPMGNEARVLRVLLTTAKAYKRFLRRVEASTSTEKSLTRIQLELPMPRFIWLVEWAEPLEFDSGRARLRWVIDATANLYEQHPYLLIHNDKFCIVNERAVTQKKVKVPLSGPCQMPIYRNNLEEW